MSTFYNVVLPFGLFIDEFWEFYEKTKDSLIIPRIPENRLDNENQCEERICMAPSIEDCLTSIGSGRLERCFEDYSDGETGIPILIHEFRLNYELECQWLIKPNKEDVLDAEITNEHWYLMPCKPYKSYIRYLNDYRDDEYCDCVYPDWAIKEYEKGNMTQEDLLLCEHTIVQIGKLEWQEEQVVTA